MEQLVGKVGVLMLSDEGESLLSQFIAFKRSTETKRPRSISGLILGVDPGGVWIVPRTKERTGAALLIRWQFLITVYIDLRLEHPDRPSKKAPIGF